MKTFIAFQVTLLKFASGYVSDLEKLQDREALASALHNQLWNLNGPRQVDRNLTPHDKYFSVIFGGFDEITESFRCLGDIEIYIRRFPYSNTSISKSRYLEYHIANYLQEIYILKNRLDKYITDIRRSFRKSPKFADANKTCDLLESLTENSFKSIILVRGSHVHKVRYSDDKLDRIQIWELLASHPKEGDNVRMLEFIRDRNYKEVRQEWVKQIKTNNKETRKLFDSYFGTLYPLVFQNDGSMFFPS